MRHRIGGMIALCGLSLCLCVSVVQSLVAQAKKPDRITYDDHVLPILKDKCASCHNQDKKKGGLVLNNYTALMQGGSSGECVKPGDPDASLLYKVMAHTSEPFMPPSSPKLPDATLDIIKKWIAGGAPENAGSKVVVPDRPKVDFTLPGAAKGKPATPPMPPATMRLEPVVKAARDTAISAIASSPWAPVVAVGGQKQVLLYHSDSLELLGVLPFPEGSVNVLKFSRNGSLLLAGGGRAGKSGKVVIWSVTKAERLFEVGDESDSVLAADVSPDQTRVALGGPGKVIRIYSTKDGSKPLHEIRKHTDWVTALEFSPDGVLLASGDRSSGLYVWESHTAREYHTLKGHTAAVTEVSWRGDSNVVMSGSEDSSIRLYVMENGNQVRAWNAHGGVLAARYARDGRIVTTGRDRTTRMWDGNGGAQRAFEALPDVALKATFSHDDARIIAGDWTGQVVVWEAKDGKRVGTLTANPPTVAEQFALAQKTLAEKQKAYDTLTAGIKPGQDALNKVNADLAGAQKAVGETAAAFKTAETKLNQLKTGLTAAQAALKVARDEVKARDTLSQALTEAAAKVKAEADKNKDNLALQKAATQALAQAGQAAAELVLAQKSEADAVAALKPIEPAITLAQATYNTAKAAMEAAPKAVPGLVAAQKTAQTKAQTDQAALAPLAAELTRAKAAVAKWQAAAALVKKSDR